MLGLWNSFTNKITNDERKVKENEQQKKIGQLTTLIKNAIVDNQDEICSSKFANSGIKLDADNLEYINYLSLKIRCTDLVLIKETITDLEKEYNSIWEKVTK